MWHDTAHVSWRAERLEMWSAADRSQALIKIKPYRDEGRQDVRKVTLRPFGTRKKAGKYKHNWQMA